MRKGAVKFQLQQLGKFGLLKFENMNTLIKSVGVEQGREAQKKGAAAAKSLQSCPTLCDPRDVSPPGSPAPGILQERTLEWVAISFSNA